MASFEKAIAHVLKWEGGFVNHKNDPGGATNKGITFNTFQKAAHLIGVEPTIENLMTLTTHQAKIIYKELYWDKMRGDDIKSQAIADILFDGFVNMGYKAVRLMQIEAGSGVDGIVGPRTLRAINESNAEELFYNFKYARIEFYEELVRQKPSLQVFFQGWMNRINSFKYNRL